ncbi:MAG TPA: hypothetical protein VGN83_23615 [Falsiroseomonas sp.]|jgi:hypothetical protein|nr:hypothetical protein [Falsiroseomonas sp.]
MSDTLKKRWSLPAKVITHIFDGEPKEGGNDFGGYHSEAVHEIDDVYAKIDGQPDPAMLQARQTGKPYQFMIKLKKGGSWTSAGLCSFFPHPRMVGGQLWRKDWLILKIEQALTDPGDSVRHSRAAWQSEPRNIRTTGMKGAQEVLKIKVDGVSCHVQYTDGAVNSVYPATFG